MANVMDEGDFENGHSRRSSSNSSGKPPVESLSEGKIRLDNSFESVHTPPRENIGYPGVGNSLNQTSQQTSRSTFETELSKADVKLLEDYDLQLALALSLSANEEKEKKEKEKQEKEKQEKPLIEF